LSTSSIPASSVSLAPERSLEAELHGVSILVRAFFRVDLPEVGRELWQTGEGLDLPGVPLGDAAPPSAFGVRPRGVGTGRAAAGYASLRSFGPARGFAPLGPAHPSPRWRTSAAAVRFPLPPALAAAEEGRHGGTPKRCDCPG